jgi:hypothetical protein
LVGVGAILSFVVHLPTWVRFARNNMYIQIDKSEAYLKSLSKDMFRLACSLFHHQLSILGLYKIAHDKSEMQSCDMNLVQVPTKG